MPLSTAPLFTDVCPGPETGVAYWAETPDGKRIRLGVWSAEGNRGTVLLFPGRTEYIEKYGVTANELAEHGLTTIAIDWRGQGLADRMLPDATVGHVDDFQDYQKDVSTLMRAARELGLPRPYFMLAHSMGGCIGLRAVIEGLPVQAVGFTAPMWGIRIAPHLKPMAHVLSRLMPAINQGHRLPPGVKSDPYVLSEPFEDNMLTTDAQMHDMMRDQLVAHPELSLGGPTYTWLREALIETNHLAGRASPTLPCISWLGTQERIVHVPRIHERMEDWKGGTLELVEGAEHEVLMEQDAIRKPVIEAIARLFLGTPGSS